MMVLKTECLYKRAGIAEERAGTADFGGFVDSEEGGCTRSILAHTSRFWWYLIRSESGARVGRKYVLVISTYVGWKM